MANTETNQDKLKALQLTLDKIEKNFGKGSVMKLGDNVVEDSGPNISITRPFGYPPTPNALSNPIEPEGITATSSTTLSPSFMTLPLPKFFSILSRVS